MTLPIKGMTVRPDQIAAPYVQGFADSQHRGVRWGPVHLFHGDRKQSEWSSIPLCGRRVQMWNFEGETETDFCPRCMKVARAIAEAKQ